MSTIKNLIPILTIISFVAFLGYLSNSRIAQAESDSLYPNRALGTYQIAVTGDTYPYNIFIIDTGTSKVIRVVITSSGRLDTVHSVNYMASKRQMGGY